MAPAQDLSHFRRCEGRAGGRCCHGFTGHALRARLLSQHLVPHQLDRRQFICSARHAGSEGVFAFRVDWFPVGTGMENKMCLLVGLLYGAMLPMLPTRPIVLGGIIAPLLWTGLLYQVLGFVNPLLDQKI